LSERDVTPSLEFRQEADATQPKKTAAMQEFPAIERCLAIHDIRPFVLSIS
jgi:hypothetical protein